MTTTNLMFGTARRLDDSRDKREGLLTPGPGEYHIPSTLGSRGGKVYSDIRPDEYSDESDDEEGNGNDILMMDNERVMC